jgi:hypothetical protein
MRRLLVTANVVPSSLVLVTLMMEALSSFETSALTRATRRNIPEDAILQFVLLPTLSQWSVLRVPSKLVHNCHLQLGGGANRFPLYQ